MRFGIHLPQYGRAAGPEAVTRAAIQAEELGFDDVWVSDHLAVPVDQRYPPAFLYEPVVTLTWAAAATSRVGLGTSVLVLPYRHPLHLAKELGSLDRLSGGRLVVGAAAGWLEGEFDALGVPFAARGRLTDEAITTMRACWAPDPVALGGRELNVRPKPEKPPPIWVGGTSTPALDRAIALGDGWHGNVAPDRVPPMVRRLRDRRPEESFVLSMRTSWDGLSTDADEVRGQLDAYREAGIQHIVASPVQPHLDEWLRSVEALRTLFTAAG